MPPATSSWRQTSNFHWISSLAMQLLPIWRSLPKHVTRPAATLLALLVPHAVQVCFFAHSAQQLRVPDAAATTQFPAPDLAAAAAAAGAGAAAAAWNTGIAPAIPVFAVAVPAAGSGTYAAASPVASGWAPVVLSGGATPSRANSNQASQSAATPAVAVASPHSAQLGAGAIATPASSVMNASAFYGNAISSRRAGEPLPSATTWVAAVAQPSQGPSSSFLLVPQQQPIIGAPALLQQLPPAPQRLLTVPRPMQAVQAAPHVAAPPFAGDNVGMQAAPQTPPPPPYQQQQQQQVVQLYCPTGLTEFNQWVLNTHRLAPTSTAGPLFAAPVGEAGPGAVCYGADEGNQQVAPFASAAGQSGIGDAVIGSVQQLQYAGGPQMLDPKPLWWEARAVAAIAQQADAAAAAARAVAPSSSYMWEAGLPHGADVSVVAAGGVVGGVSVVRCETQGIIVPVLTGQQQQQPPLLGSVQQQSLQQVALQQQPHLLQQQVPQQQAPQHVASAFEQLLLQQQAPQELLILQPLQRGSEGGAPSAINSSSRNGRRLP